MVARYTSAASNQYFDWDDAATDSAAYLTNLVNVSLRLPSAVGDGITPKIAYWRMSHIGPVIQTMSEGR
jgi:hypothetical protein